MHTPYKEGPCAWYLVLCSLFAREDITEFEQRIEKTATKYKVQSTITNLPGPSRGTIDISASTKTGATAGERDI